MKNEVITRNARIWLDETGIVRIISSPAVREILLEDAIANVEAIARVSNGRKLPCYIDAGDRRAADRDARMYYVKKFPEVTTAVAVLQKSPVIRVFVNFMMGLNNKINKGKFPAKLFETENEAIEWLQTYRN